MKAGSRGEDQLAFLLAHEIAHLTITSHQPKLSQVLRLAVVPSADRLTAKPKKKSAAADALATAASSRILSAFAAPDWTRAQEDQADGLALVLMNRAGYDPYAAAQFLGTFDQAIKAAKARAEVNRLTDFVDAGLGAAAAFIFADKKSKMDAKLVLLFSAFLLAEVAKELVKSHYHRSPAERAERCAQEAADLVGKGDDIEEQRLFARLEIDFPDIRNPAIPEAPTSLWDSFLVSGTQPMLDLAVSEDIDLGLMLKVDLDPRNICPASITSFQLALSCGQLYAQHGDRTKAVLLSDQALNDPLATADTYRRAAQIHGSFGDDAGAIAILQRGGARFSDGRLLPDQVLIFHRTGDVEGTRAAFDTCFKSSSVEVQAVCSGLQKMLQRPTAKPTQ